LIIFNSMIKLKNLLNEETITPGSKEYFKKGMSDDEILTLADALGKYPYTRVKTPAELQRFFRDVASILGFPKEGVDIMTYDSDNIGRVDKKKIKLKPNEAPLFQMFKDKKLDMKQYGDIQKPLMIKYIQLGKRIVSSIMFSGGIY
jgi:hypothetical protein